MATVQKSFSGVTPRARLLLSAIAFLAVLLAIALIARSGTDNSVRTTVIKTVPLEIPSGVVPAGAAEIVGQTASRRSEILSVAVDFTVLNTDRESLQAEIETNSQADGWNLVERVYDDRRMRLLFLNEANDTLTVTMTIDTDRILGAAVIVRSEQNTEESG